MVERTSKIVTKTRMSRRSPDDSFTGKAIAGVSEHVDRPRLDEIAVGRWENEGGAPRLHS
jgi:hypothetical protein